MRKQVEVCLLVCHVLTPLSHQHLGKKTLLVKDSACPILLLHAEASDNIFASPLLRWGQDSTPLASLR